jgi:hypothetical protein
MKRPFLEKSTTKYQQSCMYKFVYYKEIKSILLFGLLMFVYSHSFAQTKNESYVLKLTNFINDTTLNYTDRNYYSEQLKYYEFKLYSVESKNNLLNNIKNIQICQNGCILEIGALNIISSKKILQAIIDSNLVEYKDAALIALSRMGEKKAINMFFSKLNKMHPEAAFRQYYKEIEYIKQPECINFFVKLLDSNALNEMPKETMKPTKLAADAVRCLSRVIFNFPVKYFYDNDEDYAIKQAKKWWIKNKNTYKINRNVY